MIYQIRGVLDGMTESSLTLALDESWLEQVWCLDAEVTITQARNAKIGMQGRDRRTKGRSSTLAPSRENFRSCPFFAALVTPANSLLMHAIWNQPQSCLCSCTAQCMHMRCTGADRSLGKYSSDRFVSLRMHNGRQVAAGAGAGRRVFNINGKPRRLI